MYKLVHHGGDDIWTCHRPLTSIEKRILLNPIHKEETQNCKQRHYGLKRDKETDKQKIADYVDVFHTDLKLHFLAHLVQLILTQAKLTN